jgi:NRPS condensation-like uncharacterized protein
MSSDTIDIIRPLGAVEEFLWLFDHSSPKHFCLVAEVQGRTTVSDWRAALDALQERHPMLSTSIDTTYNRVPHFRNVAGEPIPLRVAEGSTPWEREVEREMRTPFDPTKAPLIRAVLMLNTENAFVILVAHHSVADGMSLVFLLRDLLKALSGQPLTRYPFPRSLDEIVGAPVRTSTEPGIAFSQDLAKKCVETPVHVKSTVLSKELTTLLLKRTREEDTTIHAIICAALAVAGRSIDQPWRENPLRIFSPVDIRRLVGLEDQCMAAFSKAVSVIEPNPMGSLWDLARFIRSTLLPFKTVEGNVPVLSAISGAMATNMNVEQGAEFNRAAFSEELMVSNVGLLPYSPDFGKVTIQSLWAPSLLRGFGPEQTIGVATVNGSIHLLHTSWIPIPGLLETTELKLAEACQSR